MIVWQWAAYGPARLARGITGDLGLAMQHAAECLEDGTALTARIDEAAGEIGIASLADGYRPTGKAWVARRQRGGGVTWVRVAGAGRRAAA